MVLEGGPWSFEGEALLLQKWEEGMTAEDFNSTKINIFVQMYGLPFELRKDDGARSAIEQVYTIKEHPSNGSVRESAYGKEYVRYRIEIDINNPILPGFFLERRGRRPTWVYLKYEKLPTICFQCGLLSHGTRQCSQNHNNEETDLKYGVWIKAEERSENIQVWSENMETEKLSSQPVSAERGRSGKQSDMTTQSPMMVDPASQGGESSHEACAIGNNGQKALIDRGKKPMEIENTNAEAPQKSEICKFRKEARIRGDGLVLGQPRCKGRQAGLDQGEGKERVGSNPPIVFKRKIGGRKRDLEGCWEAGRDTDKKRKNDGEGSNGTLLIGSEEAAQKEDCFSEVCGFDNLDKVELEVKLHQEQ